MRDGISGNVWGGSGKVSFKWQWSPSVLFKRQESGNGPASPRTFISSPLLKGQIIGGPEFYLGLGSSEPQFH